MLSKKIKCKCGITFEPEKGQTHCNYCGIKIANINNKKIKTDIKKKHHFTKLEISLISFVLLFVIVLGIYVKSTNLNVMNFFNKETALRQRYERMYYLIDNQKAGQYYDEFATSRKKSKESREDFISDSYNENPPKRTLTTHSITIKDNIGYIDRTTTLCTNIDCVNRRVYEKWEIKEGNWYQVGTEYCIRDTLYAMPPEFERALSLLKQRQDQRDNEVGNEAGGWQYLNCVDIQYASIPDAEGYFKFDQNSTLDRLTIFVDNSYKIKDDLLTAFLLSHELNHVLNFLVALEDGIEIDCYDSEILAFTSQLNFFLFAMNKEEQNSLISRIRTLQYNEESPLQLVKTFATFLHNAVSWCEDFECLNRLMGEQVSQMIRSNPYYQEQCGLK